MIKKFFDRMKSQKMGGGGVNPSFRIKFAALFSRTKSLVSSILVALGLVLPNMSAPVALGASEPTYVDYDTVYDTPPNDPARPSYSWVTEIHGKVVDASWRATYHVTATDTETGATNYYVFQKGDNIDLRFDHPTSVSFATPPGDYVNVVWYHYYIRAYFPVWEWSYDSQNKRVTVTIRSLSAFPVNYNYLWNGTTGQRFSLSPTRNGNQYLLTATDPNPSIGHRNDYTLTSSFVPNYQVSFSVFVPTDAYEAKIAAEAAQQAAEQVNSIINPALTVQGGVIQDNQGTVLQAARAAQQLAQSANNKLDNVQNALTQMQNNQLTIQNINQYLPATLRRISGVNGATATSSGALQVVLDYSNATQYAYQIDDGAWSSWMPIANKVSIPIPRGVHTLTVQVANGPVGQPGPDAVASMQVIGL